MGDLKITRFKHMREFLADFDRYTRLRNSVTPTSFTSFSRERVLLIFHEFAEIMKNAE